MRYSARGGGVASCRNFGLDWKPCWKVCSGRCHCGRWEMDRSEKIEIGAINDLAYTTECPRSYPTVAD